MEGKLISERYPVQIGHMSDPLQPAEEKYRVTEKILKILADREYPAIITSKFPDRLTQYLRAVDGVPLCVQCSISSADPAMLQILEPGAPPWEERIKALQALNEAGAHVILRIWPLIPDLCGDLRSMLEAARDAGIEKVQANFLKLYNAGSDRERIRQGLGYDLISHSRARWEHRSNFEIVSLEDQRHEISELEGLCRGLGLKVLSCDDLTGSRGWRCCCGTDGLPGFKAAPWAYFVNGHRITEHTDFETYIRGHSCPWHDEFSKEWNRGALAGAIWNLKFHPEDKTYSRRVFRMCGESKGKPEEEEEEGLETLGGESAKLRRAPRALWPKR
jgi:DNA repair photolyase